MVAFKEEMRHSHILEYPQLRLAAGRVPYL